MRVAAYFVLSMALHAAALAFPVSLTRQKQVQIIHVTILPMEQASMGSGAPAGSASPAPRAGLKVAMRTPPNGQPEVESKSSRDLEPQAIAAQAIAKGSDSSIALVSAITPSDDASGSASSGFTSNGIHGFAAGTGGIGPSANGSGSSVPGSGTADGQGSSGNEIISSQARYRETPRPDYPESARREGREGRVLLRVLVDGQGRSKQVEINSSSGSVALDRAAAEAIRRWRFHPARHGDQPVESWLRIPIEFRLDVQSW
jgi:protein TonB